MSRDMGGPISNRWWSDDKQFISSKCTTTQQATLTAFHPTENTSAHPRLLNASATTEIFLFFFLGENLWSRSSGVRVVTNTNTQKVSCGLEEQNSRRGSVCMPCVTTESQLQHPRHPAQDTRTPTTLPASAKASWTGKPRAKHTGEKKKTQHREFLQRMPHRKNINSNTAGTMQEQVWLVPWDAPAFIV